MSDKSKLQVKIDWISKADFPAGLEFDENSFKKSFDKKDGNTKYKNMIIASKGDEIIAVADIFADPNASNIHLEYIEVSSGYREGGAGKKMLDVLFKEASSKQKTITTNGFTGDGKNYLAHIFERLEKDYGNKVNVQTIGMV